jgi:hypothetical protein
MSKLTRILLLTTAILLVPFTIRCRTPEDYAPKGQNIAEYNSNQTYNSYQNINFK